MYKELLYKTILILFNLIKVGIVIFTYYKFGHMPALFLVLFYILNGFSNIEKAIYDHQHKKRNEGQLWNNISNIRRSIW